VNMGLIAEGEIHIPMEEFWGFVANYLPNGWCYETRYGIPKPDRDGFDMVISFAASSESDPSEWMEKPSCLVEWDEWKKERKK